MITTKVRVAAPSLVLGALFLVIARADDPRQDPPDLKAYIDSIRKDGMSESARDSLTMIASARVGQTIVTYPKDPESGRYGSSYASAACPKPNPTPEEAARFREQFDVPLEKELVSLKAYADLDSSGFVSTDEGSRFRMLYEFGSKAAFVTGEVGHSPDAVAKAMGMTRDQVLKSAASYNALRSRLLKPNGKPLPVVKLDGSPS